MTRRGGRPAVAKHTGAPLAPALLTAALLLIAGIAAVRYAWVSDDAYISFRYARNLVDGHGLVFNVGERVEGYSNFLWTLLIAAGMRLGFSPEPWAAALGIAAYFGSIVLLARIRAGASGGHALPIAAIGLTFMPDVWVFATSGLETSLFRLLAVASFVALAGTVPDPRRAAVAGGLLALLFMTRPDGVVFAAIGLGYVAIAGRPRVASALACAGLLVLVLIPYCAWKLAVYGDLLPNTYYAKSASLAWWDQGLAYLALFFRRYPVLTLALPLGVVAAAAAARGADEAARVRRGQVGLAMAFAVIYLACVARLGGDFMFARFAVPAAPFLLLLIQFGVEALARGRTLVPSAAAAALAALLALWPSPLQGRRTVRGVVDERAYYLGPERARTQRMGELLGRYGAGLPIRLSFGGAEALIPFLSRVPVAIESATGLTDHWIARQPLQARGRVGHEKPAPWSYLIETRRAHFVPGRSRALDDTLAAYVPPLTLWLEDQPFTLLTWDAPLMDELARRGARVPDFMAALDAFVEDLGTLPDSTVRAEYGRLRRFYFADAGDTTRERRVLERLERASSPAPPPIR